jgi:NAD(P)-dependent dehydrogenase (short-subunit alcohol dehydrogenase family)
MVSADRARSRTFVVTAAASGIGLATARRLLGEGGTVVGADLASPPDLGPRFTFVAADVTDEAAVAAVLATVPARLEGSSTLPGLPAAARSTYSTGPNGTG